MLPITLIPEQRNALYGQILLGLSGISDIWIAVDAGEFEKAERLWRDYQHDLQFVVDDLRWGAGLSTPIELKSEPARLRRVLRRHCDAALHQCAHDARERSEAEEAERQSREVVDLCLWLLRAIDDDAWIAAGEKTRTSGRDRADSLGSVESGPVEREGAR